MKSIKFNQLRTIHDGLTPVYVATESGRIKTVYVAQNVRSPAITGQEIRVNGRVTELHGIRISAQYAELGWSLLEDLYQSEDRMVDWSSFVEYMRQCKSRNLPPIGDEYLPDEVLRRRREHPILSTTIDLPPPQRGPKKAK